MSQSTLILDKSGYMNKDLLDRYMSTVGVTEVIRMSSLMSYARGTLIYLVRFRKKLLYKYHDSKLDTDLDYLRQDALVGSIYEVYLFPLAITLAFVSVGALDKVSNEGCIRIKMEDIASIEPVIITERHTNLCRYMTPTEYDGHIPSGSTTKDMIRLEYEYDIGE